MPTTFTDLLNKQLRQFKDARNSRIPWTYHMMRKYAEEIGNSDFTSLVKFHLRNYSRNAKDIPWSGDLVKELTKVLSDGLLKSELEYLLRTNANAAAIPWVPNVVRLAPTAISGGLPFPTITPLANQLDEGEFVRYEVTGDGAGFTAGDFQLINSNTSSSTTYTIYWGDGSSDNYSVGDKANHSYVAGGPFTIKMFWDDPLADKPDSMDCSVLGAWPGSYATKFELYYPELEFLWPRFDNIKIRPQEAYYYGSMPNITPIGGQSSGYFYNTNITKHGGLYFPNIEFALDYFSGCQYLVECGPCYLPSTTTIRSMFEGCSLLESAVIEVTAACASALEVFKGCSSLSSLRIKGLVASIDLSETALTGEALNQVFYDLGSVVGKTVTVPAAATGYNASIAESKGWTVATA